MYGVIQPHITIVFPFLDDISDDELIKNIRNYFFNRKNFFVKFSGVSYSDDDYIFLNCIEGKSEIIIIHDELYKQYFQEHLSGKNIFLILLLDKPLIAILNN